MHIPDGFLGPKVAITAGALSAAALAVSIRHAKRNMPPQKIPLMGLSAAFIFAAQMLNFPVAAGTSGHLIGGVLASVLLGPSAAVIVISCVLLVQCFVFADGGVTALGANIFNMAVVSSFGGYFIYSILYKLMPSTRGRFVAIAFASWVATVGAAIVCAGQLALSGVVPWDKTFPAMTFVHMLIGLGEALITTLIIFSIWQTRPELLADARAAVRKPEVRDPNDPVLDYQNSEEALRERARADDRRNFIIFGLILALGLAAFVAPFACPWPDGLDHVAKTLGLAERTRPIGAPIPDYHLPGIAGSNLATMLAGMIGTIVVFVLAWLLAKVLISDTRQDAK